MAYRIAATEINLTKRGVGRTSISISWLHRASNNVETFLLPTDAHNVKKHRVIKTF